MGLANVCVHGKYEGLYYVDNDYLDIFHNSKTGESKIVGELDFKEDDLLSFRSSEFMLGLGRVV